MRFKFYKNGRIDAACNDHKTAYFVLHHWVDIADRIPPFVVKLDGRVVWNSKKHTFTYSETYLLFKHKAEGRL